MHNPIQGLGHTDPEVFLRDNLGNHSAPHSLVVTVAVNMLNADLWRQWGVLPCAVLGHSVGEIAAAYLGGFLRILYIYIFLCKIDQHLVFASYGI